MDLVALLEVVAAYISQLFPLPDWTDSDSVRQWVRKLLGILREFATKTTTTLDDALVNAGANLVESNLLWRAFFNWITTGRLVGDHQELVSAAHTVGIDPQRLLKIAQLIAQIITIIAMFKPAPTPEPTPEPQPEI